MMGELVVHTIVQISREERGRLKNLKRPKIKYTVANKQSRRSGSSNLEICRQEVIKMVILTR